MIDFNEKGFREFLASLGWSEGMIEEWSEKVKARPPNPLIEKIVSICNAVEVHVEKKLNEFYDGLYKETGHGSILPGERIEIFLPLEIAKPWIELEAKPLERLTHCEVYIAKGWKKVWVEKRRNHEGEKEYVIIFEA